VPKTSDRIVIVPPAQAEQEPGERGEASSPSATTAIDSAANGNGTVPQIPASPNPEATVGAVEPPGGFLNFAAGAKK
jgi:hypothetical protein